MLWFIEEKNAIQTAEDATHTLHNTYSLRGAKIREPLPFDGHRSSEPEHGTGGRYSGHREL
jgi:alkyl sulfatase BDS1-like metallo-beta-lactamase superfamily hydrolase